jgi:uncharacterized protein (TIGR00730 family)
MITTKKKVVVFGGANAPEPYPTMAYTIGKLIAKEGYVALTGGGPGMMREVNRGAIESAGESWGICIEHRAEQIMLDYFTYHEVHERFDERNDRLLSLGDAFVVLPGGLGTIVEALQITQRKKFAEIAPKTPLIFIGGFYQKLTEVFDEMYAQGFISDALSDLYQFVKTPEEMIAILKNYFAGIPAEHTEAILKDALLTSN